MNKTSAIILAAGKGVRMRSDLPKVSHMLCGKPMIVRVLEVVSQLGLDKIFIVVGYKSEIVKKECKGFNVTFVEQQEQLGTGHAVMQVKPYINSDSVIVLNGDVPLIKHSTLKELISIHDSKKASATVLSAEVQDPQGYGRIVRTNDGFLLKIVEQKDATREEASIREINTGTFCFNSDELFAALDEVKPNNIQKEYYLTDVIEILRRNKRPVFAYRSKNNMEVLGVNTKEDLERLEKICESV
jgi:UDP-N-acetylglucosamine diphosphorylase/glucosamine-1-phosphate N-acetyltransferase